MLSIIYLGKYKFTFGLPSRKQVDIYEQTAPNICINNALLFKLLFILDAVTNTSVSWFVTTTSCN